MRIWKLLAALPTTAIGIRMWMRSEWVGRPENFGGDGTSQALEQDFYFLLAMGCFLISAHVLLRKNFFRDLIVLIPPERRALRDLPRYEKTTGHSDRDRLQG
jgi:hypothetical protein